jgi:hypothetical protein
VTRRTAWFLHLSTLLVGVSGLVFAWMLYVLEPTDPYALVSHARQPDVQHLHVLTAPLLVFGCGILWTGHIWARIRSGHQGRRRTGIALTALLAPMILSGYLLQVSVDESMRELWIVTHVATSCLWLLVYAVHQFSPRQSG